MQDESGLVLGGRIGVVGGLVGGAILERVTEAGWEKDSSVEQVEKGVIGVVERSGRGLVVGWGESRLVE